MTARCIIAALVALSAGRPAEPPIRVEKVSVHLFLENSGEFSDDITVMPEFFTWNFKPVGDSFTDQDRFHSFLIKVWLRADGEAFHSDEQARVRLRDEESGKNILEFPIKNVYVGKEGRTVVGVFVQNHECSPL